MDKKIEDYLHLYLGCECMIADNKDVYFINMISGASVCTGTKTMSDGTQIPIWHKIKYCKPVLRPLSDMTEEEQKELCLKMFPDCKEVKEIFEQTISDGYGWSFECERGYRHYVSNFSYIPEAFLYMLSKRFDLFDLIPAGLSIDKTKIKTKGY